MSRWLRSNCGACEARHGSADTRRSRSQNAETGWWHCFRCGAHGRDDERHDMQAPPIRVLEMLGPPQGWRPLWGKEGSSASLRPYARYMDQRLVSEEMRERHQIGACTSGPYEGRVVIPVLPLGGGEWRGFAARTVYRQEPKVLYPRGYSRDQNMFWTASAPPSECLLVVEGPFDALAHAPHAVACLGKPTQAQMWQLVSVHRATGTPVVVCLDGDAWQEGWGVAGVLKVRGVRASWVRLPPCTDPAVIPREELLVAARGAIRGGSYEIEEI